MPNSPAFYPTPLWAVIAVLLVVGCICAAVFSSRRQAGLRTAELKRRFGPEYDDAVLRLGGPGRAERELAARARRVKHFRFRVLDEADRARFATQWSSIQAGFVDDPVRAVANANNLISQVMVARGYPSRGFEQRVADLSVHHAEVVQHYRAAHALTQPTGIAERDTENFRQAVVHYRALFAELLANSETESGVITGRPSPGLRT